MSNIASQLSYRYEAATILKNMCLKELTLGNLLQIVNMVVAIKKWIIHHQSGWQPLTITVAEANGDLGSASETWFTVCYSEKNGPAYN